MRGAASLGEGGFHRAGRETPREEAEDIVHFANGGL